MYYLIMAGPCLFIVAIMSAFHNVGNDTAACLGLFIIAGFMGVARMATLDDRKSKVSIAKSNQPK